MCITSLHFGYDRGVDEKSAVPVWSDSRLCAYGEMLSVSDVPASGEAWLEVTATVADRL